MSSEFGLFSRGNHGALPELVDDGVTGFIVPPGDAGALASALAVLTRDADIRRHAGEAARARCEQRFNIRDCAAAYIRLFENGGDSHSGIPAS